MRIRPALLALACTSAAPAQITKIIDGNAQFLFGANGIAVDAAGNAYVTGIISNNAYKIDSGGTITRIIDASGDGMGHPLFFPEGIAVDAAGTAYVCSSSPAAGVFEIKANGAITRIIDVTGDGMGNTLVDPTHVAVDAAGNVYVTGSGDNAFKIEPGGTITRIIDATGDGTHPFLTGRGIAVSPGGNVYVAGNDSDNVFEITPGGTITQIIDASGDGLGHVLDRPWSVAVDGADNVFVTGQQSYNAFKISKHGTITRIIDETGDGNGNMLAVSSGLAVDAVGNVFVTAYGSGNVFRIAPDGTVNEIIDPTGDGAGNPLGLPANVAVDAAGNAYVTGLTSSNAFRIDATPSCGIPARADLVGLGNPHAAHGRAWLSTVRLPVYGDFGGMRLHYADPAPAPAILILGFSPAAEPLALLPPVPLYVDLLLPTAVIPFSTPPGATEFDVTMRVRPDPVLCTGRTFYMQIIVADTSVPSGVPGPLPLVATNRLDWTIGHRPPLLITEIMADPAAVGDASGEWFEIHNPTISAFDLNGCTIRDDDGESHVITGAPPLAPGAWYVLGADGNAGTNGGVTVDYVYAGITLDDGGDELEILDPSSNSLDRVAYDGGAYSFPAATGASISLAPPHLDAGANDFGDNWCTATSPFGAGDRGTPGAANDACP